MSFPASFFPTHSELANYGNLHEMHVCDNVGDHLQGNVYVRYEWEAEAQAAVDSLNDRWYAGELIDQGEGGEVYALLT